MGERPDRQSSSESLRGCSVDAGKLRVLPQIAVERRELFKEAPVDYDHLWWCRELAA